MINDSRQNLVFCKSPMMTHVTSGTIYLSPVSLCRPMILLNTIGGYNYKQKEKTEFEENFRNFRNFYDTV